MWSTIPVTGPPFRSFPKSGPLPAGTLDHIHRNRGPLHSGISGPIAPESATGPGFIVSDSANDTSPFIIDASGNVGIGTKAPGALLELKAAAPTFRIGVNNFTGYQDMAVTDNGTGMTTTWTSNRNGSPVGSWVLNSSLKVNPGLGPSLPALDVNTSLPGAGAESDVVRITSVQMGVSTAPYNYLRIAPVSNGNAVDQIRMIRLSQMTGGLAPSVQTALYVDSLTSGTTNYGLYFGNSPNGGTIASAASTHITLMPGSTGNVGIATTSPWRTLSVNGTVAVPGLVNDSTGFYACVNTTTGQLATSTDPCGASSERYKENIENIPYGLDEILSLRPVSFDYREDYIKNSRRQLGFIAEEIDLVLPELVARDGTGEIQGLDYPKFTSVLVKAVQEMNRKIDQMTTILGDGGSALKELVLDTLSAEVIYTREITAERGDIGELSVSQSLDIRGTVCVDDTCVSKDQFKEMILRSGVGATQTIENKSDILNPNIETNPNDHNSNEENATSTEEIIGENEEVATSTPESLIMDEELTTDNDTNATTTEPTD